MPSEIEEVVVSPDVGKAEDVAPDPGERFFDCALGSVASLRRVAHRRGQGLAVHFAIRGERQAVEPDEDRWHHVPGEVFLEVRPQTPAPVRRRRRRRHVRYELLLFRALAADDDPRKSSVPSARH